MCVVLQACTKEKGYNLYRFSYQENVHFQVQF